jgi:uncharacterized protein YjdB
MSRTLSRKSVHALLRGVTGDARRSRSRRRRGPSLSAEVLEPRRLLANITPSGLISSTPDGSNFDYTITLSNASTSSSGIGTFWFAWVPGQDYLATSPLSVTPPTGWSDQITHGGASDGYAIEFTTANSLYYVQPGHSMTFAFKSADAPSSVEGNSVFYSQTPVGTSYVYPTTPFSDSGHLFVVAAQQQQPTLSSISVTPTDPSVPKGEAEQFKATGTFSDNSTEDLTNQVTWASTSTAIATISATGLADAVAPGKSTITASMNGISGSSDMTVTAAVLKSIAVTPASPNVPLGKSQQFTATGTLSDQSTEDLTSQVTWASGTTRVATINASGLASAVGLGSSTISASLNGFTGSTLMTVTPALTAVVVTPVNPSIAKGEHEQFTATARFSDDSSADITSQVTWSSGTTSVATISAAGLASTLAVGSATISASFDGVSGSTVLTVTAAVLTSIAVTPANPSVPKGDSEQFTATGTMSDSTTEDLTGQVVWASSRTSVATVNAAGLAATIAQGTSTISATLGGLSGSTTLTVAAPALISIAVTPANETVPRGENLQFTATGTLSDQTTEDLTSQVTWASGTPAAATISASGLATAVGQGNSTISATLNGVTGSTGLTIGAAVLQSIAVTPANPAVPKNQTDQFTATGTFSDQSTEDLTSQVTWASSTPAVATITASGLLTSVAAGKTTVSAELEGVTGSTVVTVSVAILTSITLTPAQPTVPKGETRQFTATGTFSDHSTIDLTSQVSWSSVTTSVATIDASGVATAVSGGTSTIRATLNGITGSTTITVGPAALTSIAITPAQPSVPKGETEQFKATGTFSDSSTLDLTSQVTWASANTTVATITAAALATAAAVGTSSISATIAGVTGTTVMTVAAPALTAITISPQNPTLKAGQTVQFTATGTFTDNSSANVTSQVTWASTSTAVATINNAGRASALAKGTSTISAGLNGVSGSTTITVTPKAPPLHVLSISPGVNTYSSLPGGQVVVTFNQPLAGFPPGDATGGGFGANPYAVYLVPRGPGGVFAAPTGIDAGSTPIHATLVYQANAAAGTSTITLIAREPLGTDVYLIAVSGTITSAAGAPLTDSHGAGGTEFQTFEIKTSPPNATPLKVTSVTTLHGTLAITTNAVIPQPDTIGITFNKPVDFLQLNTSTVQLLEADGKTAVPAAVAYSPTDKTVYLTPEGPLSAGVRYTVRVAGTVSDDQGFPNPDSRFALGTAFTTTFTIRTGGVGPGKGPFVASSKNGHLLSTPGYGAPLTTAFAYASIPFSENVDLSSLSRYSVRLVPQKGGLNNNGPDPADGPLNAKLAFNPNTRTLIIVPTVPIGNDVYRYYLSAMKATNGDPLVNPGGQIPVSDSFAVAVAALKPKVQAAPASAAVPAGAGASVFTNDSIRPALTTAVRPFDRSLPAPFPRPRLAASRTVVFAAIEALLHEANGRRLIP